MSIKREYKTALIVIAALVFSIWGINYLKGKDLLHSYNTYYAEFDNVEGVIKSSPVMLKGIQIGTVNDLKFKNGISRTVMEINIDQDIKFSKNSQVKVYGGNLMGGKSIAIVPAANGEVAKNGDTLVSYTTPGLFDLVNDKVTPLQDKLEHLLSSSDSLVNALNKVLNPETQKHLNRTMADLAVVMHNFKNTSAKLDKMLQSNQSHFDNTLKNVDKLSENFVNLSDSLKQIRFNKIAQELNQTIVKLNTSLDKINKGDGSLAKLMNDKKLYNNLEKSSKELELLLNDLREHPKKYVHFSVFGRKDKKKKEEKNNK